MKLFNWRYRYLKRKCRAIEKEIVDCEFKRYKTLEIREEIRQEYDRAKSRLLVLEKQIADQKTNPTMEQGDIARLDDDKVKLEKEIQDHEQKMEGLDVEVNGHKPTGPNGNYPSGALGINHTIEALRELLAMLREYMTRI